MPREEEEVLCVAPTSILPPLTQRGKAINLSIKPSSQNVLPRSDKGKGKEVPSSSIVAKGNFDYINCHRSAKILRFLTKLVKVPIELLRHVYSLHRHNLDAYLSYLQMHPPYAAHHALENKRPFFPSEGAIGIFLGHFMPGLRFPLNSDL